MNCSTIGAGVGSVTRGSGNFTLPYPDFVGNTTIVSQGVDDGL
jgi:hypothetical protein